MDIGEWKIRLKLVLFSLAIGYIEGLTMGEFV